MQENAPILAWLRGIAHEGAHLRLDSRDVKPGDIFVAVPGERTDGRAFIRVAAARGAAGVLLEKRDGEGGHYPVAALAVEGLKERLGEIAAEYYGNPSERMTGVAVTGTNGKTTTAFWTAELFTRLGVDAGTIGTVGAFFKGRRLPGPHLTTPDALSLEHLYAELLRAGARAFSVEASSAGLDQGRLNGSRFKVGIFTNLTRDHLDYHGTMEAYRDAKAKLFSWPGLEAAVLNADDPASLEFARRAREAGVPVWATGAKETADAFAQREGAAHVVAARGVEPSSEGTAFTIHFDQCAARVELPIIGGFNVTNMLGVVAAALACGFGFDDVLPHLPHLAPPPGRMERIPSGGAAPLVLVDYGHTPDALEKALRSLRPTAEARGGRLWAIFGCGGDRDRGKRPMMGSAASRFADRVVVTSDNPRSEDPETIIREILAGCDGPAEVSSRIDRREAVVEAVASAAPEDVVLVAGKGHESEQILKDGPHPYRDDEAVREGFNERRVRG